MLTQVMVGIAVKTNGVKKYFEEMSELRNKSQLDIQSKTLHRLRTITDVVPFCESKEDYEALAEEMSDIYCDLKVAIRKGEIK